METIKVLCAILEQHNRVLVTQRSPEMTQPLLWEFPGGKLEAGENEMECLIREVKEELNLEIEPLTRLTPSEHTYPDTKVLLIPYICAYVRGVIQLAEHRSYQWAELSDLTRYNWCEADLPILAEYLQLKQAKV